MIRKEKHIGRRLADYLETALWASTDNSNEQGGDPLDDNYCINDFSAEALEQADQELDAFYEAADSLLSQLTEDEMARVPFLFWLSRNGHGSGFFDEGYPGDLGDALQDVAGEFGERYVEVGDDGELYFM